VVDGIGVIGGAADTAGLWDAAITLLDCWVLGAADAAR